MDVTSQDLLNLSKMYEIILKNENIDDDFDEKILTERLYFVLLLVADNAL